jgi:hypothetical protein
MRSTTRVQVLELWPVKCGSFYARKRKKAATWLQEEEYIEWMTGLHLISLPSNGLYKSEVSIMVSTKGIYSEILE